eukprot:Sspe_Gene.18226::Locus_6540_Transcript_1_1_Confidence_1.000_Length_1186::g.18226::m.18226
MNPLLNPFAPSPGVMPPAPFLPGPPGSFAGAINLPPPTSLPTYLPTLPNPAFEDGDPVWRSGGSAPSTHSQWTVPPFASLPTSHMHTSNPVPVQPPPPPPPPSSAPPPPRPPGTPPPPPPPPATSAPPPPPPRERAKSPPPPPSKHRVRSPTSPPPGKKPRVPFVSRWIDGDDPSAWPVLRLHQQIVEVTAQITPTTAFHSTAVKEVKDLLDIIDDVFLSEQTRPCPGVIGSWQLGTALSLSDIDIGLEMMPNKERLCRLTSFLTIKHGTRYEYRLLDPADQYDAQILIWTRETGIRFRCVFHRKVLLNHDTLRSLLHANRGVQVAACNVTIVLKAILRSCTTITCSHSHALTIMVTAYVMHVVAMDEQS